MYTEESVSELHDNGSGAHSRHHCPSIDNPRRRRAVPALTSTEVFPGVPQRPAKTRTPNSSPPSQVSPTEVEQRRVSSNAVSPRSQGDGSPSGRYGASGVAHFSNLPVFGRRPRDSNRSPTANSGAARPMLHDDGTPELGCRAGSNIPPLSRNGSERVAAVEGREPSRLGGGAYSFSVNNMYSPQLAGPELARPMLVEVSQGANGADQPGTLSRAATDGSATVPAHNATAAYPSHSYPFVSATAGEGAGSSAMLTHSTQVPRATVLRGGHSSSRTRCGGGPAGADGNSSELSGAAPSSSFTVSTTSASGGPSVMIATAAASIAVPNTANGEPAPRRQSPPRRRSTAVAGSRDAPTPAPVATASILLSPNLERNSGDNASFGSASGGTASVKAARARRGGGGGGSSHRHHHSIHGRSQSGHDSGESGTECSETNNGGHRSVNGNGRRVAALDGDDQNPSRALRDAKAVLRRRAGGGAGASITSPQPGVPISSYRSARALNSILKSSHSESFYNNNVFARSIRRDNSSCSAARPVSPKPRPGGRAAVDGRRISRGNLSHCRTSDESPYSESLAGHSSPLVQLGTSTSKNSRSGRLPQEDSSNTSASAREAALQLQRDGATAGGAAPHTREASLSRRRRSEAGGGQPLVEMLNVSCSSMPGDDRHDSYGCLTNPDTAASSELERSTAPLPHPSYGDGGATAGSGSRSVTGRRNESPVRVPFFGTAVPVAPPGVSTHTARPQTRLDATPLGAVGEPPASDSSSNDTYAAEHDRNVDALLMRLTMDTKPTASITAPTEEMTAAVSTQSFEGVVNGSWTGIGGLGWSGLASLANGLSAAAAAAAAEEKPLAATTAAAGGTSSSSAGDTAVGGGGFALFGGAGEAADAAASGGGGGDGWLGVGGGGFLSSDEWYAKMRQKALQDEGEEEGEGREGGRASDASPSPASATVKNVTEDTVRYGSPLDPESVAQPAASVAATASDADAHTAISAADATASSLGTNRKCSTTDSEYRDRSSTQQPATTAPTTTTGTFASKTDNSTASTDSFGAGAQQQQSILFRPLPPKQPRMPSAGPVAEGNRRRFPLEASAPGDAVHSTPLQPANVQTFLAEKAATPQPRSSRRSSAVVVDGPSPPRNGRHRPPSGRSGLSPTPPVPEATPLTTTVTGSGRSVSTPAAEASAAAVVVGGGLAPSPPRATPSSAVLDDERPMLVQGLHSSQNRRRSLPSHCSTDEGSVVLPVVLSATVPSPRTHSQQQKQKQQQPKPKQHTLHYHRLTPQRSSDSTPLKFSARATPQGSETVVSPNSAAGGSSGPATLSSHHPPSQGGDSTSTNATPRRSGGPSARSSFRYPSRRRSSLPHSVPLTTPPVAGGSGSGVGTPNPQELPPRPSTTYKRSTAVVHPTAAAPAAGPPQLSLDDVASPRLPTDGTTTLDGTASAAPSSGPIARGMAPAAAAPRTVR